MQEKIHCMVRHAKEFDEDRCTRDMKTGYEVDIDLPGFKKDEITRWILKMVI